MDSSRLEDFDTDKEKQRHFSNSIAMHMEIELPFSEKDLRGCR